MRIDALMQMLEDAWDRGDYRLVLIICAMIDEALK